MFKRLAFGFVFMIVAGVAGAALVLPLHADDRGDADGQVIAQLEAQIAQLTDMAERQEKALASLGIDQEKAAVDIAQALADKEEIEQLLALHGQARDDLLAQLDTAMAAFAERGDAEAGETLAKLYDRVFVVEEKLIEYGKTAEHAHENAHRALGFLNVPSGSE